MRINAYLVGLNTIHFYIILKQVAYKDGEVIGLKMQFEYHTFLHHSQTDRGFVDFADRLNTIHFYIILKHNYNTTHSIFCLNTIHFYIILKRRRGGTR